MSNPDPKHDPENTNFEYDEAGVRITPPSTFNTIVRETNDVKLTITIPQSLYENLKICIEDKNKRIRKASKHTIPTRGCVYGPLKRNKYYRPKRRRFR